MKSKITLKELKLDQALDLAIQIELEAKERYEEFARQVGQNHENDAGHFFKSMAENEAKHAELLKAKKKEICGTDATVLTLEDLYEFQEIEAPEFDRAESFMSAKKALLIALDCEVKAHDFFEKAEALVNDEQIKALFNELKNEELEHKAMVEAILEKCVGDELPLIDKNDVDEPNGL